MMGAKHVPVVAVLAVITYTTTGQQCELMNGCGVLGGETILFCPEENGTNRQRTTWIGPNGNLLTGGIKDVEGVDVNMVPGGFTLTIRNTSEKDVGTYWCRYNFSNNTCELQKEDIKDFKCVGAVGGTEQITIYIECSDVAGVSPEAVVTNSLGKTINSSCSYDPVGQFTNVTCKFTGVPAGNYSYTVYSHGKCSLSCANATDIIIVDENHTEGPESVISGAVTGAVVVMIVLVCVIPRVLRRRGKLSNCTSSTSSATDDQPNGDNDVEYVNTKLN